MVCVGNRKKVYHKGFSLLELILVLLVIAGIFIASYQQYKKYKLEKDIVSLQQNGILLMQQLDAYYTYLSSQLNPDYNEIATFVTRDQLTKAGYWPSASEILKTNLVANTSTDYDVGASDIATGQAYPAPTYIHNLVVSAKLNLPVGSDVDWYVQRLSGKELFDQNSNYWVRWQRLPEQQVIGLNDNLWILTGGLDVFRRYFAIPPITFAVQAKVDGGLGTIGLNYVVTYKDSQGNQITDKFSTSSYGGTVNRSYAMNNSANLSVAIICPPTGGTMYTYAPALSGIKTISITAVNYFGDKYPVFDGIMDTENFNLSFSTITDSGTVNSGAKVSCQSGPW